MNDKTFMNRLLLKETDGRNVIKEDNVLMSTTSIFRAGD